MAVGLGDRVEQLFTKMVAAPGAIRAELHALVAG